MVEFHDFLQQLKQPEYVHVLLNPIPVYTMLSGILALIVALILRSRRAQITALVIVIFAAVSVWPVGVYGERSYGGPVNEGIGLNMLEGLVRETLGYMFLASGTCAWFLQGNNNPSVIQLSGGKSFQGTILSLTFKRQEIVDFQALRESAYIALGLLPAKNLSKLFES